MFIKILKCQQLTKLHIRYSQMMFPIMLTKEHEEEMQKLFNEHQKQIDELWEENENKFLKLISESDNLLDISTELASINGELKKEILGYKQELFDASSTLKFDVIASFCVGALCGLLMFIIVKNTSI